jgi:hypothetical protein
VELKHIYDRDHYVSKLDPILGSTEVSYIYNIYTGSESRGGGRIEGMPKTKAKNPIFTHPNIKGFKINHSARFYHCGH